MAKRVQRFRHTAAAAAALVGKEGEITVNQTNLSAHVHDGTTPGGKELATTDMANVSAATGSNAGKMSAAQATELSTATSGVAANTSGLSTHAANTGNPHSVTKTQVGLANVTNDAQLAAASNLSDLANASTARTNLGLGTVSTFPQGTGPSEIPMNSQIAAGVDYIPSGTVLLFLQSSAPTGYTRLTDSQYNNAALRILSTGSVVNGGADSFTTAFGTGKVTAGHALVEAELASHSHGGGSLAADTNIHSHVAAYPYDGGAVSVRNITTASSGAEAFDTSTKNESHAHTISGSSATAGNGNVHTHGLNLNVKYADAIVCQKD